MYLHTHRQCAQPTLPPQCLLPSGYQASTGSSAASQLLQSQQSVLSFPQSFSLLLPVSFSSSLSLPLERKDRHHRGRPRHPTVSSHPAVWYSAIKLVHRMTET